MRTVTLPTRPSSVGANRHGKTHHHRIGGRDGAEPGLGRAGAGASWPRWAWLGSVLGWAIVGGLIC